MGYIKRIIYSDKQLVMIGRLVTTGKNVIFSHQIVLSWFSLLGSPPRLVFSITIESLRNAQGRFESSVEMALGSVKSSFDGCMRFLKSESTPLLT